MLFDTTLTPQEEATGSTNKNVLVSASAGTGKTYNLIQRVMHFLINEKLNIWQIIAVTFTEKAAKELKDRIRTELLNKYQETKDTQLAKHLLNNIYLLPLARISTIHSLCNMIIRENFNVIDLSPTFSILEGIKQKKAKQLAWDKLCEKLFDNTEKIEILLNVAKWICNGDLLRLFEKILLLDNYLIVFSEKEQNNFIEVLYNSYRLTPDSAHLIIEKLKEHLVCKLNQYLLKVNQLINTYEASDYYPWLMEWEMAIENTISLIHASNNYQDLYKVFKHFQFSDQLKKQLRVKNSYEPAKVLINEIKNEYKSYQDKLFVILPEELSEIMNFNLKLVKDYIKLWKLWREEYHKYKQKHNFIDFNDLEHYAYSILSNYPSVQEKYHTQYKAVLIDEYQDTNPLQEEIISLLTSNAHPEHKTSIFKVGDVKQSIYRFRGAEPNIFSQQIKLATELNNHLVVLSENRRSSKNILNFVNFIFDILMHEENAFISYKDNHKLVPSSEVATNRVNYPVELWLLQRTEPKKEIDEDNTNQEVESTEEDIPEEQNLMAGLEELQNSELEGRMIGKRLKEIIEKQEIKIPTKTNESRYLQYSDCVILMRNMKTASAMVRGLEAVGVPVYAVLRKGFVNSVEVRDALNLIRCIDNPYDDQALVGWLTSPAVGLNIQELTKIVFDTNRNRTNPLYLRVQEYVKNNSNSISERIEKSCYILEDLRERLHLENPATIVNLALYNSGLIYAAHLSPFANQKLANLKLLVDLAEEYSTEPGVGLRGLLEFYTELTRSDELGPAPAIGEGENVVRVMSVHQSKGLEFPLVVVANLAQAFNLQCKRGIVFSNQLGITADIVNQEFESISKPLANQIIRTNELKQTMAEELRILYVALTRAQHKLILSGILNPRDINKIFKGSMCLDKSYITENFTECKSELYWILWALTQSPTLNSELNHKLDTEIELNENTFKTYPHQIELKWFDTEQIKLTETPQPEYSLPEYQASETRINLPIGFMVDNYPAKMNVTDIVRAGEDEEAEGFIPIRIYQGSTDGQRIGSIYHKVFELLPLDIQLDSPEIISQFIQSIDENILPADDKKEVEPNLIADFFLTELGKYVIANPQKVKRELSLTYTPPVTSQYSLATIIQGRLDMLVQSNNGNWIIVDFKTDQVVDNEKIHHYHKQLAVYAEMIEQATGRVVEATYLYFVRQGKNGLIKIF